MYIFRLMFAGRVGSWEKLQYRLHIEPSVPAWRNAVAQGELAVLHAPNLNDTVEFLKVKLTVARRYDNENNPYLELTVEVRMFGDVWQHSESYIEQRNHELIVQFDSPRWYVVPEPEFQFQFQFRYGGLRMWLDDTEIQHGFPQSAIVSSGYFAPAGVPTATTRLRATAFRGDVPPAPCPGFAGSAVASMRATGGWRALDASAGWVTFPIAVLSPPLRDTVCQIPFDVPELGGADTWGAYASARNSAHINIEFSHRCTNFDPPDYYLDIHKRTETVSAYTSELWIVPNLPRNFVPIGESIQQEHLMYRARLPKVALSRELTANIHRTRRYVIDPHDCRYRDESETVCEENVSDEVLLYPQRAELLYAHNGTVNNPLNDPLHATLYCPYALTTSKHIHFTHVACPPPGMEHIQPICTGPCYSDGVIYQSTTAATQTHSWQTDSNALSYYRHANPRLAYINTVAAPFWSYICWLQDWLLDRNGDGAAEPTPLAEYWRPHQCQHIDHPSLPNSIRTRRRSYLLLDALAHGTWSAWIDFLFGAPSGWVGSARPALVAWLGVSERALTQASQPRWSAQNATLVFTPIGITVTPTATTHTLEFTLADWNSEPYLYPAVADRVRVWLPDTAYTSISIQLVSAENETVTIATARGTHAIPHSADTKYAGTWRRQYAALAAGYSELGWDWDTDGVSQATFADPKRALLWQLLGARAGARLRIAITQIAPIPYLLEYPRFYRDAIQHAFATDNGAHTYLHIRNAQTLNWGLLAYPIASNAPSIRLPHQPMTLYDAAALYRQLDLAEDASSTASIMAQIAAWGFDDVETGGHPAGVVRVRQMCRAAMLPYMPKLALWLINDLRECPPLPTLPTRQLDTNSLQFSGGWGQWVYFAAPSYRYYLAPSEPTKLVEVQGASETELTSYDRAIGRYHLTRQAVALDGTETLQHPTKQWRVRTASRDLARTTPYFSHALIPPRILKPEEGAALAIDARRQYLHLGLGSTLRTYHLHSMLLVLQREYAGRIECLERDSRQDCLLIVVRETGARVVYISRDAGDTASEVLRMATEGMVIVAVSPLGLWCALYQGANGLLKRTVSLDGGQTWGAAEDVLVDGATLQAKPLDAWYDARAHAMMLVYELPGGDRRVAQSEDAGLTFVTRLN